MSRQSGTQIRQRSTAGVGRRVAAYRRRRGLSQVTLAALVGRSESWLSQVERGVRGLDSLTVIRQLADALNVTPDALIGSPSDPSPTDRQHRRADPVRRYIDGHTLLLTPPQAAAATPVELLARVETLNADYQAARYEAALDASPTLLAAVDALRHHDNSPAIIHAQVAAYVITAKILHKIGESRLAGLAADRAATAVGHPAAFATDRGLAAREVVLTLMDAGESTAAENLAVAMADSLKHDPDAASPDSLSLRGSLLLLAAVIAARRADRYQALDRLEQAEQLACELGYDGNHCWTAFGPTNVAIHAVSIAAELGDAGEAVRLSRSVDPANLPAGLTSRRAQLHVDLAWAYTQQRRDAEATLQLLEVERIAPQLINYQPVIRDSIRELINRSRAGDSGVLHDLAVRGGVLG